MSVHVQKLRRVLHPTCRAYNSVILLGVSTGESQNSLLFIPSDAAEFKSTVACDPSVRRRKCQLLQQPNTCFDDYFSYYCYIQRPLNTCRSNVTKSLSYPGKYFHDDTSAYSWLFGKELRQTLADLSFLFPSHGAQFVPSELFWKRCSFRSILFQICSL